MRSPKNRLGAVRALVAVCLLALTAPSALAYDGFTLGLGSVLPYRGAPVLNVRAAYPLTEFDRSSETIGAAVRADAAYAFGVDSLPALAVSAVLSSDSGSSIVERYLGVGGGLAFTGAGATGPAVSLVAFSGVRVPVVARLHLFAEGFVSIAPDLVVPTFGLGLEYSLGATY